MESSNLLIFGNAIGGGGGGGGYFRVKNYNKSLIALVLVYAEIRKEKKQNQEEKR